MLSFNRKVLFTAASAVNSKEKVLMPTLARTLVNITALKPINPSTVLELAGAGAARQLPEREVLWSDPSAVFSIRVGKNLLPGSYPSASGSCNYLRFGCNLPGGYINHFVHAHNVVPGKTVWARVEIIRNTHADGRRFLHVDIHPLNGEMRPTHRLCVLTNNQSLAEAIVMFPASEKVQGSVAIASANAKVTTKY